MKIRSEAVLTVASVGLAVLVALGLIRWLAPQLLGIPADLRLVSVAKEVPPFYENIFREDVPTQDVFILQDPIARVRAQPLFPDLVAIGPHDVLGFRNSAVPSTADVVVIGDSQTYGNNARLEENWPSRMAALLQAKRPVVYAMATGGWAATQYLQMMPYALRLRPRVIVLAFYAGNDAAESFTVAYGSEHWKFLRPDGALAAAGLPGARFPPPPEDVWRVSLPSGSQLAFTPKLRLVSNDISYPAVRAGWEIMAEAMRRSVRMAKAAHVEMAVTVIPTKELAYAQRIGSMHLSPPAEYVRLVNAESANIARLESAAKSAGARYVDLVKPMQNAAMHSASLYPENENGHPLPEGYAVIAAELAPAVGAPLPPRPKGIVAVHYTKTEYALFLVNDEGAWTATPEWLEKNGWPAETVPSLVERDLATIPMRGPLDHVDRKRFGPQILKR